MDPLSVAGSIVGILAAASKVVEIVQPLIANIKDAPRTAVLIHQEVSRIRLVLNTLKSFLQDLSIQDDTQSNIRATYIQLDDIIVMFTDGMLMFAELDKLLKPLRISEDNCGHLELQQRLLWTMKEREILSMLERMQRFQISLSASLNILQCRSDFAALDSKRILENQIRALLASNESLTERLKNLEDTFHASAVAVKAKHTKPSSLEYSSHSSGAFRKYLINSRVYRRARRQESLMSFSTSRIGSNAWSIFTGLSLSDISNISVIALPIYPSDIEDTVVEIGNCASSKQTTVEDANDRYTTIIQEGDEIQRSKDHHNDEPMGCCGCERCPLNSYTWDGVIETWGEPILVGHFESATPILMNSRWHYTRVRICLFPAHLCIFALHHSIDLQEEDVAFFEAPDPRAFRYSCRFEAVVGDITEVKLSRLLHVEGIPDFALDIHHNGRPRPTFIVVRFPTKRILDEWSANIEAQRRVCEGSTTLRDHGEYLDYYVNFRMLAASVRGPESEMLVYNPVGFHTLLETAPMGIYERPINSIWRAPVY